MTFCCENTRKAYELMGDAKNKLDWNPSGLGFGDIVAGVLTLNGSSVSKLADYLKTAKSRMNGSYNIFSEIAV